MLIVPPSRKSTLSTFLVPRGIGLLALLASTLAACAPATPSASPVSTTPAATAVAKPAPTAAPARPTEAPKPAAKPTEAPKPAARPTDAPVARPAFDEKTIADFYKGKTVRVVVGNAAGGGYDTYSRAIGRHLSKHIPGNPTVIVENMPGAGSIIAANYLYRVAPKDGTVLGIIGGPITLNQIFGSAGIEFDMGKFSHLNNPAPETGVLVVARRAGITKFEDLVGPNGKEMVAGAVPGGLVENTPTLLRSLLGAKIKIVSGYDGTSKVRQALMSGEVDGYATTWQSVKISNREDIDKGDWIVLLQLEDKPEADLSRGTPTILDITKDEEQRQLLLFGLTYLNRLAKIYVFPPETPADRVAAMEAAFGQTFKDKEFLADAEKAKLDIAPRSGQEVRKLILEMLSMPANIKARLQQLIKV